MLRPDPRAPPVQGPPARIVIGTEGSLVVNNRRAAQIPVRVLDADGRVMADTAQDHYGLAPWRSRVHVLCNIKCVFPIFSAFTHGESEMLQCPRSLNLLPASRVVLLSALALAACSSGNKAGDAADSAATPAPTPAATATPAPMDTMSGMNMGGSSAKASGSDMKGGASMAGMVMTGNPDHDFLRMMSDHHKAMIAMVHLTKEQSPASGAVADAAKLDTKQDEELDKMQTMLEKDFKDPYTPKVTRDNQAIVEQFRGKTGAEYDRTFYQNVVKHHQQAIAMINDYLPKGKNAMLKQMAEKMKSDQTKEIAAFRKKAAAAK